MASDMDLYKTLASDIIGPVRSLINRAKFNTAVKGRITKALGAGSYQVSINGKAYVVKSRFSHAVNDVVVVIRCNNNWNELYVIY